MMQPSAVRRPYIQVIDKSERKDGTFSRDDFTYDRQTDAYTCPGGKQLVQFRRTYKVPRSGVDKEGLMRYCASKKDCDVCPLKQSCCPKEPARKILRSIHEGARQMARDITKTDAYVTASYARKKVEMLFAHLKRIMGLDGCVFEDQMEPKMSSSLQQRSKTCANSQS